MKNTIERTLNKHGFIYYEVNGESMYPLINKNTNKVLIKKCDDYQLFDIVLFKRNKNNYVLHRIINILGNKYYVIGDNSSQIDILKKKNILGKLISKTENNKQISIKTTANSKYLKNYPFLEQDTRDSLIKDSKAFFYKRKKEAYYELLKLLTTNKYDEKKITILTKSELLNLCALLVEKKALHLLAFAIDKHHLNIDPSIKEITDKAYQDVIIRKVRMDYAVKKVSELFTNNKIRHIFLKGVEIAKYYKYPFLRTSNDIDVYVDKSNLEDASNLLITTFNGKLHHSTPHDNEYVLNSLKIKVELHFNISTNLPTDISYLLNDPFNNSYLDKDNPYRYHLNSDYTMLFHLSHTAKHINGGEFWASSVSDYYFLQKSFNENLLKEARLYDFNNTLQHLMNAIYKNAPLNEIEEQLEKYLLNNKENTNLLISIGRNNRFLYILNRIFPTYKALANRYHILYKYKVLYPLFILVRWISIICHPSKYGKAEYRTLFEDTKSIVEILKATGLKEYLINPEDHPLRY